MVPSGVAAAANFDAEINFEWGHVLGSEIRSWAHQALWGPGVNMIRTPYGGRNHEYMSEDPYLAGVTATQQVLGVQSNGKTHATIKHFAGNESEYQRERWTAASRIPSRALHEIYLLPFEMVVKDGRPAAVMCAFPDLNFHWACENDALLNQTLRARWGFDGYVVSDRRAVHSTVASIKAGTDFELDSRPKWFKPSLIRAAIGAGQLTDADINNMLRPRYLKMFEFGHFDEAYDAFLPVDFPGHAQVARKAADGSIVLLKNDGLLPLKPDVRSIALIGAEWFAGRATMPPRNGDRTEISNVVAPFTVKPKQGLENTLKKLGSSATVTYNNGDVIADAVKVAQNADVVIVMVGDNPRETMDVTSLSLPSIKGTNQERLVPRILAANPNTVVVLNTGDPVTMSSWLDHTPALVDMWYGGQESGNALAAILFGDANPSGKLPVSLPKKFEDSTAAKTYPGQDLHTEYSEGIYVGYRYYDTKHVEPQFPFGFGLSYTKFEYSDLKSLGVESSGANSTAWSFSVAVRNTGRRPGAEVVQLYIHDGHSKINRPIHELKAFNRVELNPGESKILQFHLGRSAFEYWDPITKQWTLDPGTFEIQVGSSSRDIRLRTVVNVTR